MMEGLTNPPECNPCKTSITVKHISVLYAKYRMVHNKYFRNPNLASMLTDRPIIVLDTKLTGFLKE